MTNEIEFKDVAHLYLGCEVIADLNGEKRKSYLTGITNGGEDAELQFFEGDEINVSEEPAFDEVKNITPILRPLSDITAEECKQYLAFYTNSEYISHNGTTIKILCKDDTGFLHGEWEEEEEDVSAYFNPNNRVFWLLSRHFDLFGLIDSGSAIDATTLPVNPYTK